MQHQELRQCRPAFEDFCQRYERFLSDRRQHQHLRPYLLGLLGPLENKSIEPIALEQDVDVRDLQYFIGGARWDERPMLLEHRRHVRETLGSKSSIFILDPTAFPKRGDKSVGVGRQYCGERGKVDNCQLEVNLSYASERGHTFLDRRLYLPRSWAFDQARRREAGVPTEVVFRTGWQLGYEMIAGARAEGIPHGWVTGDEEFGKVPYFHDRLDREGERYIFELPVDTRVWVSLPEGPFPRQKGLLERLRKIGPGRPRLIAVKELAEILPRRAWTEVLIRDASKGPLCVEAVPLRVRFYRGQKKIRPEGWVVLSDSLDQRRQCKFFASNAAPDCSLEAMLSAGYARWPIEQDHGQGKNETGLGDYETRTWAGFHHHTALSFLAHHFLVIQRNRLGEKIPRDDGRGDETGDHRNVPVQWQLAAPLGGPHGVSATKQSQGADRALEAGARSACRNGSHAPGPRPAHPWRGNSHVNRDFT